MLAVVPRVTVTVTVTKNIYNAPPTNRPAAQYKVVHVFAELKAWFSHSCRRPYQKCISHSCNRSLF